MPRTDKQAGGVSGPEDSADRSRHARRGKALPSPETVVSEAIFISPKDGYTAFCGPTKRTPTTHQPVRHRRGRAIRRTTSHADGEASADGSVNEEPRSPRMSAMVSSVRDSGATHESPQGSETCAHLQMSLSKLPHSIVFSGRGYHHSSKASGGKDLQIEEPVGCG